LKNNIAEIDKMVYDKGDYPKELYFDIGGTQYESKREKFSEAAGLYPR
jgi:hypothetical protein